MTALTTFLHNRAIDAGFYCPCCKSRGLTADDMVLSGSRLWDAGSIAAASERYRAPICNGCMDDHVTTEDGAFVPRDAAVQDAFGGWWSDEVQLGAALIDAADDADLHRLCAAWR